MVYNFCYKAIII